VFILFFFFPMVLFAVLASPLGREQPTEVWLLARIRFLLKPRQRIWSQIGLSQLITVTAPKKEDKHLTKDLSQDEVTSRLKTLAQTLDSHGWAVKNVSVNLSNNPGYFQNDTSDRLVAADEVIQPPSPLDIAMSDDILDEKNSPTAQKFDGLIREAEQERKLDLQKRLEKARVELDRSTPDAKSDSTEEALTKMHQRARVYSTADDDETDEPAVTRASQTVKMELAQSGNAFSVATIANLANRDGGEIVVSLH
jgi:hypothetical protein